MRRATRTRNVSSTKNANSLISSQISIHLVHTIQSNSLFDLMVSVSHLHWNLTQRGLPCNLELKVHLIVNWFAEPTSFPGSLILPPGVSEERPWLGLVACYFDNWEHQGGVLCNQAVCRVELCRAATAPAIVAFGLKISNSIYSDVYLKVRQGCREIFYLGRDVVAVVPIQYLWKISYFICGRRAVQFYSEVIVHCSFSFEIALSDWSKKNTLCLQTVLVWIAGSGFTT